MTDFDGKISFDKNVKSDELSADYVVFLDLNP